MKKQRERWLFETDHYDERRVCGNRELAEQELQQHRERSSLEAEIIHVREVIDDGSIRVTREMFDKVTDCNTTDEVWQELKRLADNQGKEEI